MDFTGKPIKGWALVDNSGIKSEEDFSYWIDLALEYDKKAKSSKKKIKVCIAQSTVC